MAKRRRIRRRGRRRKRGGFLPLLPLILGGLSAAGSIANIVRAVKQKKGSGLRRYGGRRRRRRM